MPGPKGRALATIGPRVATVDTRVAAPPPKTVDPFYRSSEWEALKLAAKKRDRYMCVRPDCPTPGRGRGARLIVNHKVPRREGGPDSLDNLETLCAACDNRFHAEKGGSRGPAAR